VLAGHNFMDDRLNVTFGYEFSFTNPVNRDQREMTRLGRRLSLVNNPAERAVPGDDPNIPDRVFLNNIRYIDSALEGAVYTTAFEGPTRSGVSFLGTGAPFVDGLFLGGFSMQGGSGTLTDVFQTQLIPGLDRQSVSGSINFQLAPRHRLHADAKYVKSETTFVSQPTFDYSLYVPIDNPFIPASIRADATKPGNLGTQAGIEFFNEEIFGEDPNFVGPGVIVGRDNLDLGELVRDITRETVRAVFAIEGDITNNFQYEASYVFGHTKETNVTTGDRINERFFAAIDAVRDPVTNNIVCRSDLNPKAVPLGNYPGFGSTTQNPDTFGTTFTPGKNSGCVPVNIFGPNISEAGRLWINNVSREKADIEQHVLTAFVTGDSEQFFSFPGGGPLAFVLGGEYRKETSETEPDKLAALSAEIDEDLTWLGQSTAVKGEFDVKEIFGELSAPLLRDLPFFQAVTLIGAYRYSDYSTSGETETWSYGGQWRMNPSLMFRYTKARAVRAPNISELFLPQVQTFALLADPCDRDNLASGRDPATRLKNCTAALAPLGLNPQTFDDSSSSAAEGIVGGNPNLQPEEADTTTYGIVITPAFVPGLSISVDYYDIELSNAINTFTAQNTVNNCYDLPQPNSFCTGLNRTASVNPNFNGRINSFLQVSQNVAQYVTTGYDFSIRYDFRPERFGIQRDIGRFTFQLVGNRLDELTFIEIPGAPVDEDSGETGSPEWQASFDATWIYKDLIVNYGYSWYEGPIRVPDTYENNPDFLEEQYKYLSDRSVHDLQVRLNLQDRYAIYAGVNNFTNQKPDLGTLQTPVSIRGRFTYIGATARLGAITDLIPRF
jgi:outer membrane receptor protein involved in Fe transport